MELGERKWMILKAIIDDYITTATPIGSRTISRKSGIGFSSATIRNEMSDLEEMGLLDQPHTSAGRIPSDKAYRLYVDAIMGDFQLTDEEVEDAKSYFSNMVDEVGTVIRQTAKALSDLTQYTAAVLSPKRNLVAIKSVQLVHLATGKALLVLVTDIGVFKDMIIRIPENVNEDTLDNISMMLTKRLRNKRLIDIDAGRLALEMRSQMDSNVRLIETLLTHIKRSAGVTADDVVVDGVTNMLNYPEYSSIEKAKNFLGKIDEKEPLVDVLIHASEIEYDIKIGSENEQSWLKDCSVVTMTYKAGDRKLGSMGIIGPTRMNYRKVLSALRYIGKNVSLILSELETD